MSRKRLYMAPSTKIHQVESCDPLLELSSVHATFISNPGLGEAAEGEEIGTDSRKTDNGFWDE